MKVWLFSVGEPLPIDDAHPRLLRAGTFTKMLTERGIDVVWWTSNFQHGDKTKKFADTTAVQVNDRLKLWCLNSREYRRNLSIERILANRDLASEFRKYAKFETPPDVIVACYPVPELAAAAADYARANNIPSVLDIRDLWPDIWPTVVPRPLQAAAHLALLPFYWQSRYIIRKFDRICAVSDEIVTWGIKRGGLGPEHIGKGFPQGYPMSTYSDDQLREARSFWSHKIDLDRNPGLRVCFFGSISQKRVRFDVMVNAARLLPADVRGRVQMIICGRGDALADLQKLGHGIPDLEFPGWVNGPQLQVLAESADAGLLPYASHVDFRRALPTKAIEYLAFGLPILTSLQGLATDLIQTEECGVLYRETDPRDLARVIVELVKDPAQVKRLSENAKRVFHERFLATTVYGKFADYVTDLATCRR